MAAQKLSVHSVAVVTGEMFRYYSGAILGGFWQLFTGQAGMEELSGPIGTVSAVSQAVRYGWRDVLSLMALLTINVGIFNLLPIPALDGCKLLFLAWEGADRPSCAGQRAGLCQHSGHGGPGVADGSGHIAGPYTILIKEKQRCSVN